MGYGIQANIKTELAEGREARRRENQSYAVSKQTNNNMGVKLREMKMNQQAEYNVGVKLIKLKRRYYAEKYRSETERNKEKPKA